MNSCRTLPGVELSSPKRRIDVGSLFFELGVVPVRWSAPIVNNKLELDGKFHKELAERRGFKHSYDYSRLSQFSEAIGREKLVAYPEPQN